MTETIVSKLHELSVLFESGFVCLSPSFVVYSRKQVCNIHHAGVPPVWGGSRILVASMTTTSDSSTPHVLLEISNRHRKLESNGHKCLQDRLVGDGRWLHTWRTVHADRESAEYTLTVALGM